MVDEDIIKGGDLRLYEYEERGLLRLVPMHDGRAREALWKLYFEADWIDALGWLGWIGWMLSPLRATLSGFPRAICDLSSVYDAIDTWIAQRRGRSRLLTIEKKFRNTAMVDPAAQRLDQMRQYFGEKVALYFAFLECFTNSLFPLATLGTPVALFGWW